MPIPKLIFAVLLVATIHGCGRSPDLPAEQRGDNARKGAEAVAAATAAGDFKTVADYTYPKIVEMMGGRQKMIDSLAADNSSEFPNVRVNFGAIQETRVGDRYYALINGRMRMEGKKGVLMVPMQTLGISDDGGRTWTYVSVVHPADVRQVFPDLPASIDLREQDKPTLFN